MGKITTNGKITASGAVDIDSSDNEIEINAAIDPTTVTLQADDDITINADITGATSISAHSGQDGTGDVGFGLGVTLDAPDILLRAGDGPGGAATGAVVDVINNTPEVAADATLTVQQDSQMGTEDDPITVLNEDDPWNPYVGNNGTIDLVMFSDDSSIYTTTADSWKSVAADAYDDITLQGSDAIRDIFTERLHSDNGDISVRSENRDIVANAEIKADAGGVELIAENGRIYTKGGSDDTLNVTISGYSDDAFGTGVGLPGDTDQKAAIKIISKENLNLGSSTELTANGVYYGGTVASDNRDSVVFKSEEPDSGDPIDVAIYLGTKEITSNIEMGSGNVFIENLDVATEKVGTLVIDAGDTITFTGIFEDSLKPGNGSSTVKRIEAVSRITSTLTTPEEQGRFPHGDNPENLADGQFVKNRGVYVLRGTPDGKLFTLAEILAMTDPVPLVPPKPMEPEVRGEVEGPDTEALRRLLEQLGLGEQPELARAYPPSLNTDLDLYKAAERLNGLVPVLQNTNLIAAMDAIIVDVWRNVDSPLAPEQRAVIAQRIGDSPAKGWLVALTDFADILTAMVGRSERETVDAVMATYVIPQMEAGVFHEQTVAFVETQLIPFGG